LAAARQRLTVSGVAKGSGSEQGIKPVLITLVIAAVILGVLFSCIGRNSSAQQRSTATPTASRSAPARTSASATHAPTTHPQTTHQAAPTGPGSRAITNNTQMPGRIPGAAQATTAKTTSKSDNATPWHVAVIIVCAFVGVLAFLVVVLAFVSRQQRALPLDYVRPRTDRRSRR
jgi:cobalamin biosynthesis Mg chelatase CobN